ncbi:MAG: response regulator transcription factor [Ilumatobacter fluminis]|uniref:DNA-binding NarL/FixJ family response regulator n=1 Tax=Ilumatobacter fluminis TaxID=467091 RepID=A0A4V3EIT0_9ACTN|nr:response regulator transcription factor [Ilumatobacter fluminis]TDT15608.1 DNA-binding NarL/FixJ family response regulator [Ilumatobacter fluminis]
MTRILLVDDAAAMAELFSKEVASRFDAEVDVCVAVADVELMLARAPYELALVDLSFPQEHANGIDAMAEIYRANRDTRLAIMTQGDAWVSDLLRDAWDLLPVATVISKTAPLDYQLEMIDGVLAGRDVEPDPAVQTLLPARRNPERTPDRFADLIQHNGHAKVWNVLMDRNFEATYKNVSDSTGLKLNTVKNYRSQLLPELRVHRLDDPSLREMQEFAWRCRSFLRPYVEASLEGR